MNVKLEQIGALENSSVIRDGRYVGNRLLDGFGDVDKAIVDTIWKADEFTVTATGTSPITASVLPGAVALVTTAATEYAGDNIQVVGSRFKLEADKPVYFGAEITISDATESDLLVGLCGVDTTLTAASTAHAVAVSAGGAFFSKLDAVTNTYFKTYTTAAEVNTALVDTMTTDAIVYEFYWDGATLRGYIDGVLAAEFTTGVTTEVLTPSICFRAGEAVAKTCTVHWMRTIKINS